MTLPIAVCFMFLIPVLSTAAKARLKNRPIPEWCEKVSCIMLAFIPLMSARFEGDTYWMIAVGRNLRKYGFDRIDRINIYSFHSIAQQWSLDIFYSWIADMLGKAALVVLVAFAAYLMELTVYHIAKKRCSAPATASYAAMALISTYICTRPCFISAFLLILEYAIADDYARNRQNRLWLIPVLALFFINVHMALWPMQIVFLGTFIAEWTAKKLKGQKTFRLFPIVLMIPVICAVSLLNPYGTEGWMYPFRILSKDLSFISEMRPFLINGIYPLLGLLVFVFEFLSDRKTRANVRLSHMFLFFGTSFMAMVHVRHVLLAGTGAVFIMPDLLCGSQIGNSASAKAKQKLLYLIPVLACAASAAFVIGYGKSTTVSEYEGAMDYLTEQKNVRLYTNLNSGGYTAYRGIRGYIDGRTEPHYKSYNHEYDWFDEWYSVYTGKVSLGKLIKKYRFNYALLNIRNCTKERAYLKKAKAKRVYKEKDVEVYRI